MNLFISVLNAALVSIFLQNAIFERGLGSNILLYASKRKDYIIGFSVVITAISVAASVIIWIVDKYFGSAEYYSIVSPLLYILIISVVYILGLIVIWGAFPKLFVKIKTYVHLSVFNCAVLGSIFIGSKSGFSLGEYIGFGFGTGIGFFIAGYLLYIAHKRLNSELVPAAFRGMPIMLVYIGILSLAMYAFIGYSTS